MLLGDKGQLDKKLNLEGKKRLVAELRRESTDEAVAVLFEILKDESWYLRDLAVDALVERGRPVIGPLMDVVTGGLWYSRAAAMVALGRLGATEAAAPVARLLCDGNRTVAEAASDTLTRLVADGGETAVVRALRRAGPQASKAYLARARAKDSGLAERLSGLLNEEQVVRLEPLERDDQVQDDVAVWGQATT